MCKELHHDHPQLTILDRLINQSGWIKEHFLSLDYHYFLYKFSILFYTFLIFNKMLYKDYL